MSLTEMRFFKAFKTIDFQAQKDVQTKKVDA